ncbi:MAG: beta-ketoacyl-ACP synthase II [Clostridia bacterium]|nr:beta-ketoacyl-ACP synthase II [Clostridia bacterium]
MGVITPIGLDVESFWRGLLEGRRGIRRLERFDVSAFPSQMGAEVLGFDARRWLEPREVRNTDLFVQYALAAAAMAVQDARLDFQSLDSTRVGVIIGTAVGGVETLVQELEVLETRGPRRISPHFIPKMIPNMASGYLAIHLAARGPNLTLVTACASGANAIGTALQLLRRGEAEVILAGGSDTCFVPLLFAGICAMGAYSRRNHDPAGACRPFDAERDGMVLGEGAGVLVLETLDHALRRGAPIHAEVAGYGTYGDAHHLVAPAPDGQGEVRSMRAALRDAGLGPEAVDYINAHGTSTPQGDVVETRAIKEVLGERAYQVPVSSIKGATGHLMGAAGAVEAVATVLALKHGILPPTLNYESADPDCDLDYVPNRPRRADIRVALSNSFGFGGQNASLVFRRFEG